MENKLYIILNKADQFKKIHDFARAYGSLCWNLSKVILRKDLPRIYTMCLPASFRSKSLPPGNTSTGLTNENPGASPAVTADHQQEESLGQGLLDLEFSREEVVQEVMNAPKRRVDNEVARLADAVHLLLMHCQVVGTLLTDYRSAVWRGRASVALAALFTSGTTAATVTLGMPIEVIGATVAGSGVVTAAVVYSHVTALSKTAERLVSQNNLQSVYERLYSRRISEQDEFVGSLWVRVKDRLRAGLSGNELRALSASPQRDIKELQRLLDQDIPDLRRKAAPSFATASGGRR